MTVDAEALTRALDDVIILLKRHGDGPWTARLQRLAGRSRAGDERVARDLLAMRERLGDLILGSDPDHAVPQGEERRANEQLQHSLATAFAIASGQPAPAPLDPQRRARSQRAVDTLWPRPVRWTLLALLGIVLAAGVVLLLMTPWTAARWVWLLALLGAGLMIWASTRLERLGAAVAGEVALLAAAVLLGISGAAAVATDLKVAAGASIAPVIILSVQLAIAWTQRLRTRFARPASPLQLGEGTLLDRLQSLQREVVAEAGRPAGKRTTRATDDDLDLVLVQLRVAEPELGPDLGAARARFQTISTVVRAGWDVESPVSAELLDLGGQLNAF